MGSLTIVIDLKDSLRTKEIVAFLALTLTPWPLVTCNDCAVWVYSWPYSWPYLCNGRAIGMVVVCPSVLPSV